MLVFLPLMVDGVARRCLGRRGGSQPQWQLGWLATRLCPCLSPMAACGAVVSAGCRQLNAWYASCKQLSRQEDDRVRVMSPVQPCTVKGDWNRAECRQISQRPQPQPLPTYQMLIVNRVGCLRRHSGTTCPIGQLMAPGSRAKPGPGPDLESPRTRIRKNPQFGCWQLGIWGQLV